ncbi:hypothetical protein [Bdellovibrio sp. HCB2-146]|uniref:hypothetical protein n=1 Tax=Bdellovibrio sp. HCB2-146 TaxID=3394362 RepID=UPI0039BD53D1
MMKYAVAFLVFATAQFAFANHATLCTRPYSNDIFTTDLRLAVSKEVNGDKYLWIDAHIPYGIRPLPYKVEKLSCTDSTLTIAAKSESNGVAVDFKFTKSGNSSVQPGTISYVDLDGDAGAQFQMNCTVQAIENFCSAL